MTEPIEQEETWQSKVKTQVYEVNNGWYLETIVPHPDNPEMPEQLMTVKCDNQWWAKFLENCIEEGLQCPDLPEHLEALPDFKYEG